MSETNNTIMSNISMMNYGFITQTNYSYSLDSDFDQQNFTLEDLLNIQDPFSGTYGNTILNWTMVGLYLVGLVSCGGLGFIAWFETSGEAGPYRTLINRLTTHNIMLALVSYALCCISTLRGVLGPLPSTLCWIEYLGKEFLGIQMCFTLISICATQYLIVCYYKHLPIMDDKFLFIFIVILNFLLAFLMVLGKFMTHELPSPGQQICSGTWSDIKDVYEDLRFVPVPIMTAIGTTTIHVAASIRIGIVRKKVTIIQPFNFQAQNATNLGSLIITSLFKGILVTLCLVVIAMNNLNVEELNQQPKAMLVFAWNTILPFIAVTLYAAAFFITQSNLRAALKRTLF